MKKILGSVGVLAVVGALVLGATGAFFSDTETSTGNTFTAGAIDLTVDSNATYNDVAYAAGTWGQNEGLDITNEKFFSFVDLKPGDMGENTISLHVDNNPAWACANITITSDEDVTCTEPEIGAEGAGVCVPGTTNAFNGEIGETLSLAWWADDGDNILQSDETNTLFFMSGAKLNDLLAAGGAGNKMLKLTLADSLQNFFKNTHADGIPLNGSQPYYVGLQWCFGDMDITGTTITCDGAPVNNESQTDSLTADMTFTVIQARNQDGFRCEDTYKPEEPSREIISTQGNTWASVDGQFTEAWQADGRWGDGGTTAAENEVRIGKAGGSNPIVQAHGNNSTGPWRNDVWEDFSLVYDGAEAVFTIGNVIIDSSNNLGNIVGADGKLGITIKTKSSGETVMVSNVKLDGASPTGPDAVSASDGAKASLVLSGDTELSDGFSITGKVKLSWGGNPTSNESMGILFQIEN